MRRFLGVLFTLMLVSSLAVIVLPSQVKAATFTVNSTGDGTDWNPGDGVAETAPGNGICTLRAAIQETNALAGPDTINLPAGTYTLSIAGANEDAAATGDLDITDDLTITGADQTTTIIDGGALDRVLHIHSGKTVEVTSVTVRNGDVPVIDPSDSGGGIYNDSGTLTLTNCTITGNSAPWGGGINNGGTLTLTNSTVSNNTAQDGAGIKTGGALTLNNSTISNNTASRNGGGIHNVSGTVTLNSSIISNNTASGSGGGISSSPGAGSSTLTITSSNITGNTAGGLAGGIVNSDSGILTLTSSTVSNNNATSDAGGIRNGGSMQISRSTINGNSAGGSAGGIQNFGGATLTNVTISGNSVTSNGGGLGNWLATITLTNVTINVNSASGTGGGIYVASGTVELKNTIVANSVSGGDCGGASISSLGHNLDSDGTCGLSGPGDISGVDPLLSPLADNGGPTLTHALVPGSPAIDAGDNTDCPDTDQRGVTRPLDGDGDGNAICDIGAYEYAPPTMVPTMTLWGGLAMAGVLGLLIIYMVRRRQTAS